MSLRPTWATVLHSLTPKGYPPWFTIHHDGDSPGIGPAVQICHDLSSSQIHTAWYQQKTRVCLRDHHTWLASRGSLGTPVPQVQARPSLGLL